MSRPKRSWVSTLRASHSAKVPWLRRPVRSSVWASISIARYASALRTAMDACAAKSWTSSKSSSSKRSSVPRRSSDTTPRTPVPAAERHADQAALDVAGRRELVDPGIRQLVEDELGLAVGEDPGRQALLAGLPRLDVLVGVNAAGHERA